MCQISLTDFRDMQIGCKKFNVQYIFLITCALILCIFLHYFLMNCVLCKMCILCVKLVYVTSEVCR